MIQVKMRNMMHLKNKLAEECHENSSGVQQDDRIVVYWLRKSARQNFEKAKNKLHKLYSNREGLTHYDSAKSYREDYESGLVDIKSALNILKKCAKKNGTFESDYHCAVVQSCSSEKADTRIMGLIKQYPNELHEALLGELGNGTLKKDEKFDIQEKLRAYTEKLLDARHREQSNPGVFKRSAKKSKAEIPILNDANYFFLQDILEANGRTTNGYKKHGYLKSSSRSNDSRSTARHKPRAKSRSGSGSKLRSKSRSDPGSKLRSKSRSGSGSKLRSKSRSESGSKSRPRSGSGYNELSDRPSFRLKFKVIKSGCEEEKIPLLSGSVSP